MILITEIANHVKHTYGPTYICTHIRRCELPARETKEVSKPTL